MWITPWSPSSGKMWIRPSPPACRIPLVDLDGNVIESTEITSDVSEIQVTLPVSVFKDVPLEIPGD